MEKIFRAQKITAGIYGAVAVIVLIFTLVFMTEYKDLFGLKLKQNSQISFFHDSVLQTFNRQIFLLALIGILIVLLSFLLETFSKVPDKFALVVMEILLVICLSGSIYALNNILAVEAFYKTLDFQYLMLEGLADYSPRFTTFSIGLLIYFIQMVVCVSYGAVMAMSHVTFIKNQKKGCVDGERYHG